MLTQEAFEEHAIHAGVQKALSNIQKALGPLRDQNLIAILNRAKIALDYLSSRLRGSQYELYPKPALERTSSDLDQVNSILHQYLSDQNTGHIHTLDGHLDGLLGNIQLLPAPITNEEGLNLLQQANHYKEHTASLIEELSKSTDQLNKKIEHSENTVTSLNARIAENSKSLDTLKQQMLEITSEFQTQFSQSEDRRRNDFSEMLSELNSKHEEWHSAFR
jgi:methyl-accepting chemotaxis protein